jgi:ElaB/YqjD/DUF883 family membrane-anchored ribosome-binding protein
MSNVTTTRSQTEQDKSKSAASQLGQAAQDAARAAGQKAQDAAHTAGQKAQDFAHAAGQKASDLAHAAGQKVQEAASTAGHKVQDAASAVGHRAEDATAAVGRGLETAADKVREKLPHEGMLGRATDAFADTLDRTGRYIEDRNIRGIANDVTEVIKRNPIPAVLVAVGLGFLLGRTLRR